MYVKAINQIVEQFPYSFAQLQADNPQTSFPSKPTDAMLASFDVFPVVSTGAQYDQATQVATQEGCEYNADKQRWETSWVVRDKTAEELAQQQAELQQNIVAQTQQRLDSFANTRNYDGILSLCTYATSTVTKFQAEGQYGVEARDATWAKLYEIMAEVQVGTRPMPTGFADIEADLPTLAWPV
jgi:hypothetical protein